MAHTCPSQRCVECGGRFRPKASAAKTQVVCSAECRRARRRKQDKARRGDRPDVYRAQERVRQRRCRGGRAGRARHGPASAGKLALTQGQMDAILAEVLAASRASLSTALSRLRLGIGPPEAAAVAGRP